MLFEIRYTQQTEQVRATEQEWKTIAKICSRSAIVQKRQGNPTARSKYIALRLYKGTILTSLIIPHLDAPESSDFYFSDLSNQGTAFVTRIVQRVVELLSWIRPEETYVIGFSSRDELGV